MALADNIVGIIGNVISILLFLAPMKTFRKIFKAKSTMNFKSTPYVCTLLSVMLWTYYGLVKPATLIVTINGAGTFLELLYVSIFLYYADRKGRIRTTQSLLVVLAFFGAVVVATITAAKNKDRRVMVAGIISVIFSIIMYASPLRAMKMVVTTKSVTYMPFTLSAILLTNGAVWFIYALLVSDIYVMIPNGVGMAFGMAQLLLYIIFMRKSKKIQMAKEAEEKSRLQNNGYKSDSTAKEHAIDMDGSEVSREQDMKTNEDRKEKVAPQKLPSAVPDGSEAMEDKNMQDSRTPTRSPTRDAFSHGSPATIPTSSADQVRPKSTKPGDSLMATD